MTARRARLLVLVVAVPALGCARTVPEERASETPSARCLPDDIAQGFFSDLAADMCVVAKYDVPTDSPRTTSAFTWGRDGLLAGPAASGSPALVRYQLPAGATGALMPREHPIAISEVPSDARFLPRAIDLPVGGGTVVSYAPPKYDVGDGEVVLVREGEVVSRRHVPGASYLDALTLEGRALVVHAGYGPLSPEPSADGRVPTPGLYASLLCSESGELPPRDGCSATEPSSPYRATSVATHGRLSWVPSPSIRQEMRSFRSSIGAPSASEPGRRRSLG